jgi:hypothetical protein
MVEHIKQPTVVIPAQLYVRFGNFGDELRLVPPQLVANLLVKLLSKFEYLGVILRFFPARILE